MVLAAHMLCQYGWRSIVISLMDLPCICIYSINSTYGAVVIAPTGILWNTDNVINDNERIQVYMIETIIIVRIMIKIFRG